MEAEGLRDFPQCVPSGQESRKRPPLGSQALPTYLVILVGAQLLTFTRAVRGWPPAFDGHHGFPRGTSVTAESLSTVWRWAPERGWQLRTRPAAPPTAPRPLRALGPADRLAAARFPFLLGCRPVRRQLGHDPRPPSRAPSPPETRKPRAPRTFAPHRALAPQQPSRPLRVETRWQRMGAGGSWGRGSWDRSAPSARRRLAVPSQEPPAEDPQAEPGGSAGPRRALRTRRGGGGSGGAVEWSPGANGGSCEGRGGGNGGRGAASARRAGVGAAGESPEPAGSPRSWRFPTTS
uniref:translation initiation factor IF-2-like n=1 Tax=Ictidomys tridecemlineatus TaxID=43179 RepID=UPI001A9DB013|nr:translation initiation factor IF-2-like [Ictidomys tridecemlineatus]